MNKIPERCSNQKELNKLVQVMLELALDDIRRQGVNPLVVETYRPQERQNYLYCQGHTIAECFAKGISKAFAEAYCPAKIISHPTTTVNSVHTSRKAVDIVPQRKINGKMAAIWNVNDPQTQIIIKTMQKYGFEAGANWTSFPDSPHFQVKGEFTSVFKQGANTIYVTKAIQVALNKKIKAGLTVDGAWGTKTTIAVNAFREFMKYKNTTSGQIGKDALKDLMVA